MNTAHVVKWVILLEHTGVLAQDIFSLWVCVVCE